MNKINFKILMFGSLGFGLSIILGAFAAHSLKETLSAYNLSIFETGVKYQFMGCIGILLLGLISGQAEVSLKNPFILLTLGIVLFSGSLYFLALKELMSIDGLKWIGAVTPIGGLAMIISWIWVGLKMSKKLRQNTRIIN